jgi:hypothetical protein
MVWRNIMHRIFLYISPIIYMAVISHIIDALPSTYVSDDFKTVALYPIFEEVFKYLVAKKFPNHAFVVICLFGIWEIVLLKLGIILTGEATAEVTLLILYSFIALNFHVSTAFAYAYSNKNNKLILCVAVCLLLHILFNSIDFIIQIMLYFFASILVSFAPLALLAKQFLSKYRVSNL